MAVIQISKIQMRRGGELDLPGKPRTTSPLVFEPGLDIGEFGYAVDTGRLFLGHSPNYGNPNYKRIQFPYENLEVLTEASIDTIRRIFNFLRRDIGGTGYFKAILPPSGSEDFQDVRMQRGVGGAVPFRFPGSVVMANIEYFAMLEYEDAQHLINNCSTDPVSVPVNELVREPVQQGTLRALSEDCAEEALMMDNRIAVRRADLITPDAMDPNVASNTITFRLVRGGGVGERYFRFQYHNPYDHPVTMWFAVQRPLSDGNNPFDFVPAGQPGSVNPGYTREDIEDIVGEMVQNNIETNITVSYDDCGGKLDFVANAGGGGGSGWDPFTLTLTGDASGGFTTLDGTNTTLPLALAPTGVVPGTYVNATVTVDAKGRVTTIASGQNATDLTTVSNLGTGIGTYRQKIGNDLQFKSLVAGPNVTLTTNLNEIIISSTGGGSGGPSILYSAANVGSGSGLFKETVSGVGTEQFRFKTLRAGPNIILTNNADDITITSTASGGGGGGSLTVTGKDDMSSLSPVTTVYPEVSQIVVGGYASVAANPQDPTAILIDIHSDNVHQGCTFVRDGSLAVETPQDGRFAGIEVPLVNSDFEGSESAYWYYDPEYSAWTAYRDWRHPGSCEGEHPSIDRLTDVRGRFFIPERPAHAWAQRPGSHPVVANRYTAMCALNIDAQIEEARIITVSYAHADETNGVINVGTAGFTSIGILYINGVPVMSRDNTVLGATTGENTMQYIDEEMREGPIEVTLVVLARFDQQVRATAVRDPSMVVESILNNNRGTPGNLNPAWLPADLPGPETPPEPPPGTQYWAGTTVLDMSIPGNGFAWGYQYWEWKGTGPAPEPPSPQGSLCTTSSPHGPPIFPLCFIGNSNEGYPRQF